MRPLSATWSRGAALVAIVALSLAPLGLPADDGQATPAPQQPMPTELERLAGHSFAEGQLGSLQDAAVSLPIAAALGALLAFRPRRRGTPPRKPPVIQTQIILAIVGALVMLVVGASLARAFGIVGAASLIRYRAKIDDPKDAGVMLSTLGVGLASGVGLYLIAVFSTIFIMLVLWIVESLEPEGYKLFDLKIKAKALGDVRPGVEDLLRRNHIKYELRTSSNDEICYEVQLPFDKKTDRISNAILRLDRAAETAVEWEAKKEKG